MKAMLIDIVGFLIKRLIILKYRLQPDWLGTGVGYKDERTDFTILVNHYYDDYYTIGTRRIEYPQRGETE